MEHCKFCSTEFKYKRQYNEHIACCEFIYTRSRERNENVELVDDPIPNPRMMYELIKNLMFKNQQLEKEIAGLSKIARREKKKINVLEYLKNHQLPQMDYTKMMEQLIINTKNLETVLSGNIIDGVCSLIMDLIKDQPVQNFPISAFSHKPNTFYFYSSDTWQEMPHEKINMLFDILSSRFMRAYRVWEKTRPELNVENEDVEKQKMVYFKKVLGVYISDDFKYRKFTTWLFDKLKQNVKNIIEYEFC